MRSEPRPRTEEELVPEDDAVIGRAFRWSLAVILGAAAVVAGVLLLGRGDAPAETVRAKDPGRIPSHVPDPSRVPEIRFTDVTKTAGIAFSRENGATGDKLLPETMGGGVAFLDHDSDGDPDLLFVNGAPWPGAEGEGPPTTPVLYENDGAGRFTDVTAKAGLDFVIQGMGVAAEDYDGDGRTDLFLTAVGRNRLLRNVGGRFEDVTERAGVGGADDAWSTGAGFFDADGDGDLDLFVLNYVRWSREIDFEVHYTLNGRDRAYGPPGNFEGAHAYLYRNDGDGTFTDVSAGAGVEIANRATGVPVAKALALAFADHDRDGDLDVFVANDTVRNFLFENRGDGTFEEVGEKAGFAYDGMGGATGAMGIDASFYRGDEALGIGIGNFANEMTSLYVTQRGLALFSDEAIIEGIGAPSRQALTFGVLFLDVDLDGREDFLQVNGHLEETIREIQESQRYRQPAQLFWNAGPDARRTFVPVPKTDANAALFRPIVGRGVATADIDGDGDLDLVLTQTKGPAFLLRNDTDLGHRWLRVRVAGPKGNPDAIGARVELTAGGRTQRRLVSPTRGYLSRSETTLTFGLGDAAQVDRLVVTWPDGTTKTLTDLEPDRLLTVTK